MMYVCSRKLFHRNVKLHDILSKHYAQSIQHQHIILYSKNNSMNLVCLNSNFSKRLTQLCMDRKHL